MSILKLIIKSTIAGYFSHPFWFLITFRNQAFMTVILMTATVFQDSGKRKIQALKACNGTHGFSAIAGNPLFFCIYIHFIEFRRIQPESFCIRRLRATTGISVRAYSFLW